MRGNSCKNCYWFDRCSDAGVRCEHYDPLRGSDRIVAKEYEDSLTERVGIYDELIAEQQDLCMEDR